jgi:two-component system NarL family sensor kinase
VGSRPISPSGGEAASIDAQNIDEGDGGRLRRRLLVLVGLAALLITASLVRELLDGHAVGRGADRRDWLIAIIFTVIGGRVAAQQRHNRVAWLMIIVGTASAITVFTATYATTNVVLAWMSQWTWWVSFGLLPIIAMLFPDGSVLSSRWRLAVWIAAAGVVVPALLLALAAIGQVDLLNGDRMPTGIHRTLVIAFVFATLLTAIGMVAGVATLLLRWRRARGDEYQQLKWLLAGAVVALLAALLDLFYGMPGAWLISASAIPLAAGIAITKYHLYDIDPIINRSVVYAGLTAAVVGLYDGMTAVLGSLFEGRELPVGLISAGVVAVALQPLREHLQLGVDRLMYGERNDPYAVLSRLGQQLETTLTPQAILPNVVETLVQALKLSYAAIEVRSGDTFEVAAATGRLIDEPLRLPVIYQGELIGRLVLGPRARGERFSLADERLLADVARQAGIAVYTVQLTSKLQHSEERLVTTHEKERRRLRRDLYEGVNPILSGVVLQVGAIRSLLHDPELATALLDRLRGDVEAAIADIQRLIQELEPSASEELGLPSQTGRAIS